MSGKQRFSDDGEWVLHPQNQSPHKRCVATRADSLRCTAPAVKGGELCWRHVDSREKAEGREPTPRGKNRAAANALALPNELVRSLRAALGVDAEVVLSAFSHALDSDDAKLRLTAATTITAAVTKLNEAAPPPSAYPTTLTEVDQASMADLASWIYMSNLEMMSSNNEDEAVAFLRERIPPRGVELLRLAFF